MATLPQPVDGRLILPLPHPSGQSRWLNDKGNRASLELALHLLSELRGKLACGTASS